jgi:hypothetical protein
MKSYEAIQKAISGNTVEHAKRLHRSTALINKWQEPTIDFEDSGSFNPLDRIETIIETSLALGTDTKKALAPIQFLAERFNQILIPVPDTNNVDMETVVKELMKTIEEFGHLSKEAAEALKDNKISPREVKKIEKEVWDLIRQASIFLFKAKAVEGK